MAEFSVEGYLEDYNDLFMRGMGYRNTTSERNVHWKLMMHEDFVTTDKYKDFASSMAKGEFVSDELKFRRANGTSLGSVALLTPSKIHLMKSKAVFFGTDAPERKNG